VTKLMCQFLLNGKTLRILAYRKLFDDIIRASKNTHEHARKPRTSDQLPRFKSAEFKFISLSVFFVFFKEILRLNFGKKTAAPVLR